MEKQAAAALRRAKLLRWITRLLMFAWAIYWVYLIFTGGYGIVPIIYMVLIVAILALTWRQELIGGVLLILQVIFAWSTLGEMRFELNQFYLLMIIPPLLVGVLLILGWWLARYPPAE
jgi:hypothetical protein